MSKPSVLIEPGKVWEADFESHERWQMVSGLAATPAQRLDWLEQMKQVALRSGALPCEKEDNPVPRKD